jgi:hypothetical protein
MTKAIRFVAALLACSLAGFIVAGLGGALLPESPRPTQAVQDALEGRSVDTARVYEWLEANRRPGRLLVWVGLPTAALAMGAVAGLLSEGAWFLVAPIAVLLHMAALTWGSRLDPWVVELTVLYVVVSLVGAWGAFALRKRWARPEAA